MTDAKGIGRRIKLLREHSRMTRKEFGKLFSSRETTVCEWENGHCTPRIPKLIGISAYFGVSLDCVISGRAAGDGPLERLLCGEGPPEAAMNVAHPRHMSRLVSRFHSLSDSDKERLLGYLDALHHK